jgi:hypothetical protein
MPVLLILSGWRTSGHCTRLPNELRRVVTRVDARNQASRGRRYVGSNVRLSRPISFCVGWSHRLRLTVIRPFERESAPVIYQQCGRFLPPGLRQGRDCAHPLAIQRRHRLAHDRHGGDQQLQLRQPAAGSAKLGPERHPWSVRGDGTVFRQQTNVVVIQGGPGPSGSSVTPATARLTKELGLFALPITSFSLFARRRRRTL